MIGVIITRIGCIAFIGFIGCFLVRGFGIVLVCVNDLSIEGLLFWFGGAFRT